jgi:integrase
MSEEYTIGWRRGKLVLVYIDASGTRRRHSLGTADAGEAKLLAPALFAELTRPKGKTIGSLWQAYEREYEGRAIVETMKHTQKAIKARFWDRDANTITVDDCKAHIKARRDAGISDWTIYTELSHVSNVCGFAVKRELIKKAPYIFRPPQPRPKEDKHLTRQQVRKLIDAAKMFHVRLAIILLYTTAARASALCGLTWDRCDFERDRIDLRDPTITRPHKGRAIVPMLRTAKSVLQEAKLVALSEYVIEWAGQRVKSLKKGLKTARREAGITKTVSPHILRHSAAVHMAEDGRSMEEIQQFIGHSDINVTRKIYARFSPSYLKDAAAALEMDDLGPTDQRAIPRKRLSPLKSPGNLVGATGIEPVTPTMSR